MWTAEKISKAFRSGQIYVATKYSNDSDGQVFTETYTSTIIHEDWPDGTIRNRLTELNAVNLDIITLGPPSTKPVVIPPTTEQLQRIQFIVALEEWRRLSAILNSGVSTTVKQADVDTAYATMKTLYQDQYAALFRN
jgi:hypothetical protein